MKEYSPKNIYDTKKDEELGLFRPKKEERKAHKPVILEYLNNLIERLL